jgi:hypothetical protein
MNYPKVGVIIFFVGARVLHRDVWRNMCAAVLSLSLSLKYISAPAPQSLEGNFFVRKYTKVQ